MESSFLALIFLFGSSLLTAVSSAIQTLGKAHTEELAAAQLGPAKFLFKKSKRNKLSYALTWTKTVLVICYSISAFIFSISLVEQPITGQHLLLIVVIILSISLIADTLLRCLSLLQPEPFFKASCQVASLFILPFYPLAFVLYKFLKLFPSKSDKDSSYRLKDKILEILNESEFSPYFDQSDQKLILSVVSFKERIAREVMVPRINMFTLSADTSVKKAGESFLQEEYSRIPIWKDNVDNIIGTLYYKDLLGVYHNFPDKMDQSVEKLIKPIVYAPETKKISQLLQEFRLKQIHMAIVVDEYGGTEGIVTIEDILEELVGDIADETDYAQESLYTPLPSGGWIVDARMTILDIEEELGVDLPQSPEYDTVGGFIFHKAGAIPSKGWRLHQDTFDLEVLSSSERMIEKIRITPH